MLPVEFDASLNSGLSTVYDRPIHLEITDKGKDSPMLRLSDDRDKSVAMWSQAPAIYWDFRVFRPKSLAEVLLVDGDIAKSSRSAKCPCSPCRATAWAR